MARRCATCEGHELVTVDSGYIAGAGPDVHQAARVRAQLPAGLWSDVVGEDLHRPGHRHARGELPPAHEFRERVTIITATQLHESAVNDTGVTALPGRYPAAGWDGEPGAMSPVADRGGY